MITLNGINIRADTFPDNTPYIKGEIVSDPVVRWDYEGMEELFDLMCIKYWMDKTGLTNATLVIPYLPNARMDKTMDPYEALNLTVMGKAINRLNFKSVMTLDVHSVQSNCINDLISIEPTEYIKWALEESGAEAIFFPDKGACDRYAAIADMLGAPYTYGKKTRNYNKRTVIRTVIDNGKVINGKNVLIVDDICSKGSTFMRACESLKAAGSKDVSLYVTHCEPNIMYGDVLGTMRVYTTNSLERFWRRKEGTEMRETVSRVKGAVL